eukprot:2112883-Amphidinium_carterae.1
MATEQTPTALTSDQILDELSKKASPRVLENTGKTTHTYRRTIQATLSRLGNDAVRKLYVLAMVASSARRAILILEAEITQIEHGGEASTAKGKKELTINRTLHTYVSTVFDQASLTFAHVGTSNPAYTIMSYIDHIIVECSAQGMICLESIVACVALSKFSIQLSWCKQSMSNDISILSYLVY